MKYYKAEDVVQAIAEYLAWNDNRINKDKNDCIDGWEEWIEDAEDVVYNLSTIEVMEYPQVEGITPTLVTTEQSSKVGEWRASTVHSGIVKCSVCGYQAGAYAESKEYKFCPNCGAKMKEDN